MSLPEKAVVLLSGGVDSATVLFMAAERGFALYTLTFDYGQKNIYEVEAAAALSRAAGANEHRLMRIDLFGGSTLTPGGCAEKAAGVPDTYVPARNMIFLSFALSWAEAAGAGTVFYGANCVDFSGYPDCTGEFIRAFNTLARTGLSRPVRIESPVLKMSKSEIVRRGRGLGVDYSLTHSCYFPKNDGSHCRRCASCMIRMKVLAEET